MEINQRFEHYTITEIIGEGGMGLVGKAVDAEGHVVAIKQLKEHILGHHEALARFEREQRVQSVLQHPNIVPLIDAGEVGGIPYFVMPFVEGESLSQRLRRGALNYKQAQAVIRDIGSALTFAHQNNILHRDIKPGNIMLHPEGRAYLTDFGIATDPDSNPTLQTRTIHLSGMGTPDYMAPEVLRGQRSTQLSEIYSFGVTIYEMLTGQRYVNALHQNENPLDGLPPQLAQVLQRATHVSLPARYPHISAFTDDCLRILTSLANQPKPKVKPRPAQQNAPTPQFFTASPQYTDTESQSEAPSYRMVFTIGMVMVLVATVIFFMLILPPSQPLTPDTSHLTGTALDEQMRNVEALSLTASQSIAIELTTPAPTVSFTMTPTETLVPVWQTETAMAEFIRLEGQNQQTGQTSSNMPANTGYQIGQQLYIDAHTSPIGIVYLQPTPHFSDFVSPITHGTQVRIFGDAAYQILPDGTGQWWWFVQDATGQTGYIEEAYLTTIVPQPIVTITPRLTLTFSSRPSLAAWGSGTVLNPIDTTNNFTENLFTITVRDAVTLTGLYRYEAEFNDYSWEAITLNDTLGWVRQSQWQATTVNNYPPLEPWGQGTALTNPNPANLRTNPNHSATIVVQIIAGSRLVANGNFQYDEASDEWWWLVTANRTTGWIPQSELREP